MMSPLIAMNRFSPQSATALEVIAPDQTSQRVALTHFPLGLYQIIMP